MPPNCLRMTGFNTQPPEGGWRAPNGCHTSANGFNTQPPEGGWLANPKSLSQQGVSTHSRPKAAGPKPPKPINRGKRFQHTAARRRLELIFVGM